MTDSSSPDDETGTDLVPAAPPPAPIRFDPAGAAALPEEEPDEPELDAHGFDPARYRWVPVLRKPRRDGWTPQRQLDFIRTLADTGIVEQAAAAVGMTVGSCYRLRNAPEGVAFAAAWEAALAHAARRLVDVAFERAVNGSDEPVFDKQGRKVGRRMRQNDRLLMFLLRGYLPERFRYAHRDLRQADEPMPPAEPSLDEALARLGPVEPPEPHLLLPPDALADALDTADLLDGELPHWHRGRGDAERDAAAGWEPPVNPELERMLHPERGAEGDEEGAL